MDPDEWDNLAWWVARTYIEGFKAEELIKVSTDPAPLTSTHTIPTGPLVGAPVGDFAARGFSEYTIGADGVAPVAE